MNVTVHTLLSSQTESECLVYSLFFLILLSLYFFVHVDRKVESVKNASSGAKGFVFVFEREDPLFKRKALFLWYIFITLLFLQCWAHKLQKSFKFVIRSLRGAKGPVFSLRISLILWVRMKNLMFILKKKEFPRNEISNFICPWGHSVYLCNCQSWFHAKMLFSVFNGVCWCSCCNYEILSLSYLWRCTSLLNKVLLVTDCFILTLFWRTDLRHGINIYVV